MQQALKQNSMHQQLLQHMIEQQDLEIYDLMLQVCNVYSFYYYYLNVRLDLSLLKLEKAYLSTYCNIFVDLLEHVLGLNSVQNPSLTLTFRPPRSESNIFMTFTF
jgi:hypothetical protein